MKLSLYVWTDVFSDWTDGIAFALARDPAQARRLICKEYVKKAPGKENLAYCRKMLKPAPERIDTPRGFQISGGS